MLRRLLGPWQVLGIAIVLLAVSGLVVVVRSPPFLGVFLLVGSVVLAFGSVPLAVIGVWVSNRYGPAVVLGAFLGMTVVGSGVVCFGVWLASGLAGWSLVLVGAIVLVIGTLGMVVPLGVGAFIAERFGVPFSSVLIGWPFALGSGFVVFVAPGGVSRYNVLFLDDSVRSLVLALIVFIVVVGPGILGVVVSVYGVRITRL